MRLSDRPQARIWTVPHVPIHRSGDPVAQQSRHSVRIRSPDAFPRMGGPWHQTTGCLHPAPSLRSRFFLAACSSNGSVSPTSTSPSSSVAAPTSSRVAVSSTVATTIPFVMARNARGDVTTTGSCHQVKGEWVLGGVVKNSATTARTYQIVVDFVTQPGDTVLDTKIVTTPSVNPGAIRVWSATSTPGLTHVACVIRQVQAPA